MRNIYFSPEFEEAVPCLRTPRQDHVSGSLVLPDKDLAAFKTQIGRQANGLTSAVEKELGCARHRCPPWIDIYHDISHRVKGRRVARPSFAWAGPLTLFSSQSAGCSTNSRLLRMCGRAPPHSRGPFLSSQPPSVRHHIPPARPMRQ